MLSDHDSIMQGALMTWELFRRMGYSADDIFFAVDPPTKSVFIELRWGGKLVAARIGTIPYDREEAEKRWYAIAEEWNGRRISDEELHALLVSEHSNKFIFQTTWNMRAKGLPISPQEHARWN